MGRSGLGKVGVSLLVIGFMLFLFGFGLNALAPEKGVIIEGQEVVSAQTLVNAEFVRTNFQSGGPEGQSGMWWKFEYVLTNTISDVVLSIKGERDDDEQREIVSNLRFKFRYGPSDPWIHQGLSRLTKGFIDAPITNPSHRANIEYGRGVSAWKSFMQYTMEIEEDGQFLNSFTRTFSGAESSTISKVDGMSLTDFFNGQVFLEDLGAYDIGTNTPSINLVVVDDDFDNFRLVFADQFLDEVDRWNNEVKEFSNVPGEPEFFLSFPEIEDGEVPRENFLIWKDVIWGVRKYSHATPGDLESRIYTDKNGDKWVWFGERVYGILGYSSSPLFDNQQIIIDSLGSSETVEWDLNYIDISIPRGQLGRNAFVLWVSGVLADSETIITEELFFSRPVIVSAEFVPPSTDEQTSVTLIVVVRNDGDSQGQITVTPIVTGFDFSPISTGQEFITQGESRTFTFNAIPKITNSDTIRSGNVVVDCGDVSCIPDEKFVEIFVEDIPHESCLCDKTGETVSCEFERNNPDVCEIDDELEPSPTPTPTIAPITEKCGDEIDNDGDGAVDEGCDEPKRTLITWGTLLMFLGILFGGLGFLMFVLPNMRRRKS